MYSQLLCSHLKKTLKQNLDFTVEMTLNGEKRIGRRTIIGRFHVDFRPKQSRQIDRSNKI